MRLYYSGNQEMDTFNNVNYKRSYFIAAGFYDVLLFSPTFFAVLWTLQTSQHDEQH